MNWVVTESVAGAAGMNPYHEVWYSRMEPGLEQVSGSFLSMESTVRYEILDGLRSGAPSRSLRMFESHSDDATCASLCEPGAASGLIQFAPSDNLWWLEADYKIEICHLFRERLASKLVAKHKCNLVYCTFVVFRRVNYPEFSACGPRTREHAFERTNFQTNVATSSVM